MSPLDSLGSSLETMGFAQLGCAFIATFAYAFSLNASMTLSARLWAGLAALVAAATFSALTPSWVSGVALMGLAIVATGAFVAGAWLLAAVFGLRTVSGSVGAVVESDESVEAVAAEAAPPVHEEPAGGPLSLPAPSH
ncbi:MAG TPA: hypothetical protein VHM00_18730 [Caldimonas sp.]|jgi:hypothetical protein|nr:hypothetical protein [Caldimonas sp.]HEX2543104.1 hypothetical protein [Caldimonas sp.]